MAQYYAIPLRDSKVRQEFVKLLVSRINDLHRKQLPSKLYRGTKLHANEHPSGLVAFFTESLGEAEVYARNRPYVIHIWHADSEKQVIDMTNAQNWNIFTEVASKSGVPKGVVSGFISYNTAANPSHENDMFLLMKEALQELDDIVGFYRVTFSSTLDKNAPEFSIYRTSVPVYID
jgi:hypothetical protein